MRVAGAALVLVGLALAMGALARGEPSEVKVGLVAPYRFDRGPSDTLDAEIAFYKQRAEERPEDGLDLAILAGLYLQKGRRTHQAGWLVLSEQAARRSLHNLPFSNAGAWVVLARLAEQRHEFNESLRLADTARKEQPGSADALAVMITSCLGLGRVAEADRHAARLLEQAPSTEALCLRAMSLLARGRDDAALECLHVAITREAPYEPFASARARELLARFHLQRGRLTLARDLAEEALRITPGSVFAMTILADASMAAGRPAEADGHYAAAYGISGQASLLYLRALARHAMGDRSAQWLDDAEKALREEVRAGGSGHRRDLARLLLDRPDGAREALTLAREEAAQRRDAATLEVLARALIANGRKAEARRVVQEALATGIRDVSLTSLI